VNTLLQEGDLDFDFEGMFSSLALQVCPVCKKETLYVKDANTEYEAGNCNTCGYWRWANTCRINHGGGKGRYVVESLKHEQSGFFLKRLPTSSQLKRLQQYVNVHKASGFLTLKIKGDWKTVQLQAKRITWRPLRSKQVNPYANDSTAARELPF
jgi:uncharacterized protein YbaR (Trm112 family)